MHFVVAVLLASIGLRGDLDSPGSTAGARVTICPVVCLSFNESSLQGVIVKEVAGEPCRKSDPTQGR